MKWLTLFFFYIFTIFWLFLGAPVLPHCNIYVETSTTQTNISWHSAIFKSIAFSCTCNQKRSAFSEAQTRAFSNKKCWAKLFLQSSDVLRSSFNSPPCGRPTEAACQAVSHSSSVPVGRESNNGPVWLMGERNRRQSFISVSYCCTVSFSVLFFSQPQPQSANNCSLRLQSVTPPPRPVNVQFKHTHTQCCIPMHKHESGREREISEQGGKSVWKQWMFTRWINERLLNHLVN